MRRGLLGSIAALAAGATVAWGQGPALSDPASSQPAPIGRAGDIIPVQGPAPTLMPPITVGPPGDPLGMGPTAGLGPPPGPMWPPPGPYAAPMFQPPPPMEGGFGGGPGGGPGGPGGGHCGHGGSGYGGAPHVWFKGEYMLLFAKDQPIPYPLLTTSSPNQNGLIGQPTTIGLIPAGKFDYGTINGMLLSGGFYGDHDRRIGFEMNGFYSEQASYFDSFIADATGSAGIPVLARPFIDPTAGASSLVIVSPSLTGTDPRIGGSTVGRAYVTSSTQTWSLEPNGLWNLYRSQPDSKCWMSADFLLGYKHLELQETLGIHSSSVLNGGVITTPIFATGPFGFPIEVGTRVEAVPVGVGGIRTASPVTVNISDQFTAINRFNGANFGFRGEIRYGMFTLTSTTKIAVGSMFQQMRVRGITSFESGAIGLNGYSVSGLYANSSTIGTFSQNKSTVIPEINVTLGMNLTRSISMYIGYNAIYIDNVIRPGRQLNPVIDSAVIPFDPHYGMNGTVQTARSLFLQDNFLLQGLTTGFSFRY